MKYPSEGMTHGGKALIWDCCLHFQGHAWTLSSRIHDTKHDAFAASWSTQENLISAEIFCHLLQQAQTPCEQSSLSGLCVAAGQVTGCISHSNSTLESTSDLAERLMWEIFFFLFRLCLGRCKFLQLGDPADLSLAAFQPLGMLAGCTTAKRKHMFALVISGEEIPKIHSATCAQALPKSRAPGDGTGDPFTTNSELWDPLGTGGEHKHLDALRCRLPKRCHSTCLTL